MESERYSPNYLNLEQVNRINELVDGLIVRCEEGYQDVYQGTKRRAILYAGDYVYGDPQTLILARRPKFLTVEASTLFNLLLEIFKDDIVGNVFAQRIRKSPEPETLFLSEFIKTNRNKESEQLDALQSYYNLNPTGEGSDIVLTMDQYLMPEISRAVPISEVWTLRKYDNGLASDTKREKRNFRIIPRSQAAILSDE